MLKALEILKFLENGKNLELLSKQKINEAIEELEALQNRSCSNCRHYKQSSTQIYKTCYANKVNGLNLESDIDFCCNKWEVKNEF